MERQQIRTNTKRQSKTCRRSEVRAYHERRSDTTVHPNSECKWLDSFEIGKHVDPVKKIGLFYLKGRDAGGIEPPGHITEAVAAALQRKHSAADPAGD